MTPASAHAHRKRQAEARTMVGRRYRDHGDVFTWPDGRPLHPENIANWFEQHTRAAELPRIRLHDVRHSYATAALKAGISAKVTSAEVERCTAFVEGQLREVTASSCRRSPAVPALAGYVQTTPG